MSRLSDYIQYAQRVLARNHSGSTSVKSKKYRRNFKKSRCWHCEMPKKNRTQCCRWL